MEGWPVNATSSSRVCFIPVSGLLSLCLFIYLFISIFWFPTSSTSLILSLSISTSLSVLCFFFFFFFRLLSLVLPRSRCRPLSCVIPGFVAYLPLFPYSFAAPRFVLFFLAGS
ncbi:hypothetical protein NC652_025946 [Populus alba x Populus x berolinensis]|nr:hypothetical protein NC652_025946 [Populus alba x Populus x berolinensis]